METNIATQLRAQLATADAEVDRLLVLKGRLVNALKTELIERDAAAADAQHSVRREYEKERADTIRALLLELGELA